MVISANTKIGSLIRENAGALDAIVSISPRFEKLRNPVLRKFIAGRTSIAAAAKMGNCEVNDFFEKLRPLGFEIDETVRSKNRKQVDRPAFMSKLASYNLEELDVRPILAKGSDPLALIMQKVKWMKTGQVLKIINTFYPGPLVTLLQKQGFETYCDEIDEELFETYFYKKNKDSIINQENAIENSDDWEKILAAFGKNIQVIDVRHLAMPQPMMAILSALDTLPSQTVLFVFHKRIPVYLLPELHDRNFEHRIRGTEKGEIEMLIFKKENE